jgi:acyl-CoA synthetase (AMP-forming)/AMP-acid ligase II
VHADFLRARFAGWPGREAMVWRDRSFSYDGLRASVEEWSARIGAEGIAPGCVVSLEADFTPTAVALLLALIDRGCVVVPLTASVEANKPEFREVAQVERTIVLDEADRATVSATGRTADHPLLATLRARGRPGLVLFSSGSTGKSKAAVHDFVPLLDKFRVPRHVLRTISFLLFDHIGGVNTLFYTLSNGGSTVTVEDRSPDAVLRAIERHRVQLLPTSPTFLNLLLVSEAHRRYDLSSLTLITYGTEVMPESTLRRLREALPSVELLQTYGLSELGILRSKSRAPDSLWVKLGGEGFQTRVVDGLLEIKAASAMLGYLNAPSPFTEDGWFKTGDAVEVDGEYYRIRGRTSEIINVGGEKVYPAEVESVLQMLEGVEEVVVSGEPSALTGQIVKARVRLRADEELADFRRRMNAFCRDRLPRFKTPQKVELVRDHFHGERFKKMRLGSP